MSEIFQNMIGFETIERSIRNINNTILANNGMGYIDPGLTIVILKTCNVSLSLNVGPHRIMRNAPPPGRSGGERKSVICI